MGTITISVDDEVEASFRKVAGRVYGEKKGYLGNAITRAMDDWLHRMEEQKIAKRQMELLRKGLNVGRILYKNRDELHDR